MGGKIDYLEQIADTVTKERKKRKMSQISFFNFLFPDNGLDEKNIKSKMNDIENSKRKTIDPDFLKALHEKCNLSMDYIFGYERIYPNHDNKTSCCYTGLSVDTVELLNKLAVAIKQDVPPIESNMSDEAYKYRIEVLSRKQEAEWVLKILEVLLTEDIDINNGTYANYNILFDLYMMSIMKPTGLRGIELNPEDEDFGLLELSSKYKDLYLDSLYVLDSFGGCQNININTVHQQVWKNKLNSDLEKFIPVAQKYFSKSSRMSPESNNRLFVAEQ